jgi:hypothetical protein
MYTLFRTIPLKQLKEQPTLSSLIQLCSQYSLDEMGV